MRFIRAHPIITLALLLAFGVMVAMLDSARHAIAPLGSAGAEPVQGSSQSSDRPTRLLQSFNASNLQLPASEIESGGPPKDGIPALTDPHVVPAERADFLEPDDRIVAVTIDDESRAYPVRLLNWHEAVNDQLGETPYAVVYCPLCDSVTVVDRRIDDKVLAFGISGLLHNSNVLLYDRTDEALWSQVGLVAVSGPHAGESLKHLPWQITTFERWHAAHPEGTVASFDTGHRRDYSRNPYASYFAQDRLMFPIAKRDDRLPLKAGVVGVKADDVVRAYPVERVAAAPEQRVVEVFGDERLVLEADAETGSVRVLESPETAQVVHTFWFTWAAYHPETTIFGADDE